MINITGLDEAIETLQVANQALRSGEEQDFVASFDPNDPSSIEQAIILLEGQIDAQYPRADENPILREIVEELKSRARKAVIESAASARIEGSSDGE